MPFVVNVEARVIISVADFVVAVDVKYQEDEAEFEAGLATINC